MSHFNNRRCFLTRNKVCFALDSKSSSSGQLEERLKNCSDTRTGIQQKINFIDKEFNDYDNINFHGCRITNLYNIH